MDKRQEIVKMMDEWKDETNERSVFAMMEDEHHMIMFHCRGGRLDIIKALASVIAQEKDIYKDIISAMVFAINKAGLRERLKLAWTFLTVRI